jgi:hypothetical protein
MRPQNLVDVLNTLNQQSTQSTQSGSFSGLAGFAEADETAAVADSVTATAQAAPGWDQSTWGAFVWG